jgi:hypothetical protein
MNKLTEEQKAIRRKNIIRIAKCGNALQRYNLYQQLLKEYEKRKSKNQNEE